MFPGALCVVGVALYLILKCLYTCAAALGAEVPPKIFSENQRGVISTGQHQTNEEVVNGISQPFFNVSSGPMDSGSKVRGPEINFLRIQVHALKVIFKNVATNISCHNFGHGSDLKFVVQIFAINTSHFFNIENTQRLGRGLWWIFA